MALEGCYSCVKYLMFAFNFLFWILGCVILGVGIWIKVDPASLQNLAGDSDAVREFFRQFGSNGYESFGAYVLIVIGSAMMLIGFLGCCGAIKESQCMLATFFVFLTIIFVALLVAGVYVIIVKDKVREEFAVSLQKEIEKFKQGDKLAEEVMTSIQNKFECCGAGHGFTDYGFGFAGSQCRTVNYFKPCASSLYNEFTKNIVVIGGVAIGIAAVMLLGMIFSMLLCCAIRENMS